MSKKRQIRQTTASTPQKENTVTVGREEHSKELVFQKTHSGPLPTPEDLQKYENILSGAAERIFSYAEREQFQRHSVEKNAVEIEDHKIGAIRIGVIGGYIVNAICVIVAGVCAYTDHPLGISVGAYPLISYLFRWLMKKPDSEENSQN